MSGDESFLARWSRRKRKAVVRADAEKNSPPSAEIAKPVSPATDEPAPAMPLPPIEAIETVSDIRAFLSPDVPVELTRAALRRAWMADPVIRDFIGLSENAWDFNAPGGVPGFGSLDREEVLRLVAQLSDEPRGADPNSATVPVGDDLPAEADPAVPTNEPRQGIAGAQDKNGDRKAHECRLRRRYGGALSQ